jgi:hypothetical protein
VGVGLVRFGLDKLPEFVPAVEIFMLDFELEPENRSINRHAMKRLLVLPRGNYKKVFGWETTHDGGLQGRERSFPCEQFVTILGCDTMSGPLRHPHLVNYPKTVCYSEACHD